MEVFLRNHIPDIQNNPCNISGYSQSAVPVEKVGRAMAPKDCSSSEKDKQDLKAETNDSDVPIKIVKSCRSKHVYCRCQSKYHGEDMVKCDTCNEWFHEECLFAANELKTFVNGNWEDIPLVCDGALIGCHTTKSGFGKFQEVKLQKNSKLIETPPSHLRDAATSTDCLGELTPSFENPLLRMSESEPQSNLDTCGITRENSQGISQIAISNGSSGNSED